MVREKEERRGGRERGQTLLEFAILVPILLIMVAFAVDAGRFLLYNASVNSAADTIAREIEATPTLTEAQALDLVQASYPEIADTCSVEIGTVETDSTTIQQHLANHQTGNVEGRPSTVQTEKHPVRVEYTGTWITPGLIAASSLVDGDGKFRIGADATGIIDATIDAW